MDGGIYLSYVCLLLCLSSCQYGNLIVYHLAYITYILSDCLSIFYASCIYLCIISVYLSIMSLTSISPTIHLSLLSLFMSLVSICLSCFCLSICHLSYIYLFRNLSNIIFSSVINFISI